MKGNKEIKPIEYYLDLDYPVTVYEAPEGGFVVEVKDLPGCLSEGDTLDEAYARIKEVKHDWIEIAYEDGQEIPLPITEYEYSGNFVVRTAKYLHRELAERAKKEGVSLNQMIQILLSSAISVEKQKDINTEVLEKLDDIQRHITFDVRNQMMGEAYNRTWEVNDVRFAMKAFSRNRSLDRETRVVAL